MKRTKLQTSMWIVCALMTFAGGVSAQVVNQDSCPFQSWDRWYASEPHKTLLKIADGGRTGKCMHAKNTTAQPLILLNNRSYQMELANDPIEVEVWAKGQGSLHIGIQPYDAGEQRPALAESRRQAAGADGGLVPGPAIAAAVPELVKPQPPAERHE